MRRTAMFYVAALALPLVLILLFAAVQRHPDPGMEGAARLFFGWIPFLGRVLSRLTVNWGSVATAAVCVALLLFGGHGFLSWFVRASPADEATPNARHWPPRATASLLGLVVLMFTAGISFVGVVHQVGWLATSPEPLTDYKLKLNSADHRLQSFRWSFGSGVNTHRHIYKHCPANGAWREGKQGVHSWQARMLGSINVRSDNIDFRLDWDEPKNVPAYQRFVPDYLNPDIGELRDARGFALSHFAGNEHVLGRDEPLAFDAVTDGTAQTIFCGEVAAKFKAWGDPTNLRDPARGVNRTADGFGSPDERGAYFVMLDGSVRFLSRDTDPRVLSALATPDGGEPAP